MWKPGNPFGKLPGRMSWNDARMGCCSSTGATGQPVYVSL
jgi:hypothetical protein